MELEIDGIITQIYSTFTQVNTAVAIEVIGSMCEYVTNFDNIKKVGDFTCSRKLKGFNYDLYMMANVDTDIVHYQL